MTALRITLAPGARKPERAHPGDAGLDLGIVRSVPIKPGETVLCSTGVSVAIPDGYTGLVVARSSLHKRHGLALANGVGVVDADFRGEIMLPLRNVSERVVNVMSEYRLAQLVIVPVALPACVVVDALEETARGAGGVGSTGL